MVLVVVSFQPVTKCPSKMCTVVSVVACKQNCTNHECTDPLGDPTDTHKDAIKRIHDPNMEQSVIVMGVCSGLTSHIDPFYK